MTTLLLDIDGVLLPWGCPDPTLARTGFADWAKHSMQYFSFTSQHQLTLIASTFDRVIWLTTWEINDRGANIEFSDVIGWQHNDSMPWLDQDFPQQHRKGWWKAHALIRALGEGFIAQDEQVLWVDDELNHQSRRGNLDIVTETAKVLDRDPGLIVLHAPKEVWHRNDIELSI